MATTKRAKIADANDGADSLEMLLDAIYGANHKPAGNGLLKGKK